ncbi:sensor histidine kinase [Gracilimonas tropica]|uniref:sensor histidine kinase n=1 Tax=Gracilimonas tropica TaxID=454600 RepID=UPI00037932B1|nr:histidine kinase [Gracilimonas tropica]
MNPKIPKAVEIFVHILAVAVIVILGVRSYELINFMVVEGYTISSKAPSDTFASETLTLKGFSAAVDSTDRDVATSAKPVSEDSATSNVITIEGKRYNVNSAPSNQVIWHVIVYGLYIIGWFVAYFLFFKRFHHSLKKKLIALSSGWLAFTILHMGIVITVTVLLNAQPVNQPAATVLSFGTFSSITESPFAFYFLIVFMAFLAQTTVQFLYRYQELEQADHMQSELALIRSQLRPHFFFNTLNNLYSMALETKNELLADGIQNLTGMMRYSLKHSTKELVPLKEEWAYIEKYIELQKLRINQDSVEINMEVKGRLNYAQVAPMILINFVENAFKHGISYEKASFVNIKLEITDEFVILDVRNSNHPSKQDTGTSGIGTAQTKKLLKLYYESDFDLDIRSASGEHTVVLKLPIR